MDIDIEEKHRKVIPRWRDFKTTLALGELRSALSSNIENNQIEVSLDEQITDWENNKTLAFATDLVGSGFVLGKTKEVDEAADFILSEKSSSTKLQRRIAKQVKDSDYFSETAAFDEAPNSNSEQIISNSREKVRIYREQLRNSLRNPIKLVELSREYATLGSLEKAIRTMDIAVALAPANRFVVRSATKLFVHAKEIERAHHVLRRAPSLRSDPWLLSAEIAVSSMMNRSSHNIKIGMSQINDANYDPFDVSELTSAIATWEITNANSKLARKLFRKALRRPTENTVAQAEWASRAIQSLDIEAKEYNVPLNYEALAWSYFKEGELLKAFGQGRNWILDQPFAVSPVAFSSMVANLTENFGLAKIILNFGLRANPENVTLRNNLAFTFASNNEPDLAAIELEKIDRTSLKTEENIVVTATEGLIKFRQGLPQEGRILYRRAMEIAKEKKEPGYVMRALVFLAREEVVAETEFALSTLEEAEKEAKRFHPHQEMKIIFNRLHSMIESNRETFMRKAQVAIAPSDLTVNSQRLLNKG